MQHDRTVKMHPSNILIQKKAIIITTQQIKAVIKSQTAPIVSIQNKYCLEVWIGLAKIKSTIRKNSFLENAQQGYVNITAMARNKSDYKRKAKAFLVKIWRLSDLKMLSHLMKEFKTITSTKVLSKGLKNF